MCFKTLGVSRDDIMQESHYKELGYELGFSFSDIDSVAFMPAGTTLGDKVARIESLSRLRGADLREQWTDCSYRDVDFSSVRQWDSGLQRFKTTRGMLDYTDLLEQFDTQLEVDLFILDEAQDLSPLQWKVVEKASAGASHVYLAGDDDQCIYDWAGADPSAFINHIGETQILPTSYRIPRKIQEVAESITRNISVRQPKSWNPREAEGSVSHVMYEDSVDLSKGTWLLLARNHMTLQRFETMVQKAGYPYLKEGSHSTNNNTSKAIYTWEAWRKGKAVDGKELRALAHFLPAIEAWQPPKGLVKVADSPVPEALLEKNWMDALVITPKKREYIRACLFNKEDLFAQPRITISTIHRAKGGEAEHVVLIPDITQNPWNQINSDSEQRVLYVAVTRAKESLTIVHPHSNKHYRL